MDKLIYITRLSAFQIQCGGLDRLQVWLTKPHYSEPFYFEEIDVPFGSERELGCYAKKGWQLHGGKQQSPICFSALFGYDSDIAIYVWDKLNEHFGNANFREWDTYEKENEDCNIKNFFLTINLNIEFKAV